MKKAERIREKDCSWFVVSSSLLAGTDYELLFTEPSNTYTPIPLYLFPDDDYPKGIPARRVRVRTRTH